MKLTSSNGHAFQIDECDIPLMGNVSWCVHMVQRGKYKYVVNNAIVGGEKRMRLLHRVISGAGEGQMVDHINGDTLDNRRSNLRICCNKQNQWNQRRVRGAVQYKGVTFESGKFRARIRSGGVKIHLGIYHSAEDAARAYRDASSKLFGDHSYSNFQE